ncbi:MAG: hypothetical protein L0H19_03320 [Salinisphaera sp.]|nr:hypothetical protein [Salinisphaera sp.]
MICYPLPMRIDLRDHHHIVTGFFAAIAKGRRWEQKYQSTVTTNRSFIPASSVMRTGGNHRVQSSVSIRDNTKRRRQSSVE